MSEGTDERRAASGDPPAERAACDPAARSATSGAAAPGVAADARPAAAAGLASGTPVGAATGTVADTPQEVPPAAPDPVSEHASPLVRAVLLVVGSVCVGLGFLGLFLPLLPTTPFLLLAAACYARASRRFYDRLVANRTFGPLILEWQRYRSIPFRAKVAAIVLMTVTFATSIVMFVRPLPAQVALGAVCAGLAWWMARLPSRDRPGWRRPR